MSDQALEGTTRVVCVEAGGCILHENISHEFCRLCRSKERPGECSFGKSHRARATLAAVTQGVVVKVSPYLTWAGPTNHACLSQCSKRSYP